MIGPYRGPWPCPTCGHRAGALDRDIFAEPFDAATGSQMTVKERPGAGNETEAHPAEPSVPPPKDLGTSRKNQQNSGPESGWQLTNLLENVRSFVKHAPCGCTKYGKGVGEYVLCLRCVLSKHLETYESTAPTPEREARAAAVVGDERNGRKESEPSVPQGPKVEPRKCTWGDPMGGCQGHPDDCQCVLAAEPEALTAAYERGWNAGYKSGKPVPQGMVLVPVEAPDEMLAAGAKTLSLYRDDMVSDATITDNIYRAMLSAAPPPDAPDLGSSRSVASSGVGPECPTAVAEPECHGLDTPERVCFYEQDFYPLSNFSAFSLRWMDLEFDTSEAAYHWTKFWQTSPTVARVIREAPSAHEAFKIAERHKCERRGDWDEVKVGIMRDILRAKAAQHEYVRRKLLATGDRELVENSWRDDFWGWGPNRDGQNMLGKLWMEVRAELAALPSPAAVPLTTEGEKS